MSVKRKRKKREKPVLKNKPVLQYLLLALIISLFVFQCIEKNHIQDDAFISFRYVENFTAGDGIVFNQNERVEGYTSLLWVMLLGVFNLFGVDLVKTSQYLSFLFGVLVLIVTFLISVKINSFLCRKRNIVSSNDTKFITYYSTIPVFLLAVTGAFRYWAVSGMETSFFIFVLLTGILFYIREITENKRFFWSAIFFAVSLLIRPEAILIIFLTFIHKIIIDIKTQKKDGLQSKIISREILFPAVLMLLLVFIHTIFRLIYYGYPLPNTFYAKTGFSLVYVQTGLNYIFDFLQTYMIYGLIIILLLSVYKTLKPVSSYLFSIIIFYLLYVIIVGGDVLPLFRFILPLLPLIFILFISVLFSFALTFVGKNRSAIVVSTLLITAGYSYYLFFPSVDEINSIESKENILTDKMKDLGNWFYRKQKETGKSLTVAVTTIGAFSYYSKVKVIDMLGLTDEYIAHHPQPVDEISGIEVGWKERNYNAEYVISLKPDYIVFSTENKPSAYAERALFTSEEFLLNYYCYYIIENGKALAIYKRKPNNNIISISKENRVKDYSFINLYSETLSLSDNEKILKNCYELIRISPPYFSPPYHLLGQQLELKGDIANAVLNYKKALELDEFNFAARMQLAAYYRDKKDKENMHLHLSVIKKHFPDYYNYLVIPE